MSAGASARWRVERGAFKARGNRWEPFTAGSTNQLWRGSGPSGEWLLKWYRYPELGVHPEPEVGRFLREAGFEGVPEFGARLDRLESGGWVTTAYVQRWIDGRSAWDVLLEALRAGRCFSDWAMRLGRRVGALHAALASGGAGDCGAFGTRAYSIACHATWTAQVTAVAERLRGALVPDRHAGVLQETWDAARRGWVAGEGLWRERIARLQTLAVEARACRIHGDLHLGQVLESAEPCGGDPKWWMVDFEGEPLRPLQQRRALDLPLRDVAGMWRSFDYAIAMAGGVSGTAAVLQEAFLEGWVEEMRLPEGDWKGLLEGLVWEKAIYEALYELKHRPAWFWVPLRAIA